MTDSQPHDDLLRQKDEEIEKLKFELKMRTAESAWYEGQATHASSAASSLIAVVTECFEGFGMLLESFRTLVSSASECGQSINLHFIEHKQGKDFDPDYVRRQVAEMTLGVESSTQSMRVAYDKFFGTLDSMKSIQKEMLKAPPPFGESFEQTD